MSKDESEATEEQLQVFGGVVASLTVIPAAAK